MRRTFHNIPVNHPLKGQPIFSKRSAFPRSQPTNGRRLQAKPGDIVYYVTLGKIRPMRVLCVDDCWYWSRRPYQDRKNYCIYYDLQPLKKIGGKWVPARLPPQIRKYGENAWRRHNNKLWSSGWVGHSVDMDEFAHTYAEAKIMQSFYRDNWGWRKYK